MNTPQDIQSLTSRLVFLKEQQIQKQKVENEIKLKTIKKNLESLYNTTSSNTCALPPQKAWWVCRYYK